MQKKDVLENAAPSAKNFSDHLRCGECLHYKVAAHSQKGDICSKMGINAKGLAPVCFTPDITILGLNGDQLASLTALLQGSTKKSRRILMSVLKSKSKKQDYQLGTKVYWRALGGDYVSNYVSGFVLGYSSSGELMISGDPDKHRRGGRPYVALLRSTDDILDYLGWKERRENLIQRNRIQDPTTKALPKRTTVNEQYEPPTLDTAPTHWFNKTEETRRRRVREVTEDLKNE